LRHAGRDRAGVICLATGPAVPRGQRRVRSERRKLYAGTVPEFGAVDLRFLISLASGHQH
jgi:hypothetical protein